jgi:hypothetical protein
MSLKIYQMKNPLLENHKLEDVLPLTQQDINLIFLLRNKHPWGPLTIDVAGGVPKYLIKTVERTRL